MNDYKIINFKEIESTNTYVKQNHLTLPDFSVITAEVQTKGRGRLSKTFYSNQEGGLYMSLLLKKYILPQEITIRIACAVQRAISKAFSINCQIKWVNDIYVEGKKVCGILCEGTGNGDIICGIGVNVTNCDFPLEIKDIAACLRSFNKSATKEALLPVILEEITSALEEDFHDIISYYKSKCFVIGKSVTVSVGDENYPAIVKDIAQNGNLIVMKEDNSLVSLSSGEIILKLR